MQVIVIETMMIIIIIIITVIIIIMNLWTEFYEKIAVLCTSLLHFVCIKLSFRAKHHIYAKPIHMHIKCYHLT